MKLKRCKPKYREIGYGLISCLDFAMKYFSRFIAINLMFMMAWYSIVGYMYLNGTPLDKPFVFDSVWLKMMWFLYVLFYSIIYFMKRDWNKDKTKSNEIVGTAKFVDYSEYKNLRGKFFNYDGYTFQVLNYKRIITILNEEHCFGDNVFEVGRIQEDGTVYSTIWTKDELYMALAEDESSR